MNAIKFFKFNYRNSLLGAGLLTLVLVSCSKSNDDYYDLPDAAAVGVVHASAGLPALDVALDNNRLGVSYFNYTDRIEYFRAYTGNREIKVYNAGAASANPLFSKGLSFDAGKYYTVFIVDTAAKMDAVSLGDSTRSAGQDSVRIRFANMSPDASGLDLYVKGEANPIATNITYKKAGNFFSYKATFNIVFELRPTGQNTLLATMEPINLMRGNIYTIWSGGYRAGSQATGTRIKLDAFAH
ncbi:DUF4397 domain-containing protein [Niabella ginsengisoli]|uniref:DUF4397 domain-containing protein n=1 Tax=Niabella ginsengisoli TaxID=522298 RepID=A0ABS9SG90_9BACT|nr:DUF4397 domain-containing protein [Niabella ginsengisoli]MCH5597375.1 DUF4397 domain-containing protein [Niabella ginsengisoli]